MAACLVLQRKTESPNNVLLLDVKMLELEGMLKLEAIPEFINPTTWGYTEQLIVDN
jgi:hypothetical protein